MPDTTAAGNAKPRPSQTHTAAAPELSEVSAATLIKIIQRRNGSSFRLLTEDLSSRREENLSECLGLLRAAPRPPRPAAASFLLEQLTDAFGGFFNAFSRGFARILHRSCGAFAQIDDGLFRRRNGRLQQFFEDLRGQVRRGDAVRPASQVGQMD